jgi:uncharacterized protein (DUF924 family)
MIAGFCCNTAIAGCNNSNVKEHIVDTSKLQSEITAFMFLRDKAGEPDVSACLKTWFGKDNDKDDTICDRYGVWVECGLAGDLDSWMATPGGALALMILLDEFPRNIYRHTVTMFAGDGRARRIVDAGHDWFKVLRPEECLFVPGLILTHQESLADQEECVIFYCQLEPLLPQQFRVFRIIFEDHLRIIDRNSVFQHRDHYYGRETSAVGRKLLDNPQLRFELPLIVDRGCVYFGYYPMKLWAATEHAFDAVERMDGLSEEHRALGFGSLAPSWLSPRQIAQLNETFREFDRDGDNALDRDELMQVLEDFERHYAPARLQHAIDLITGETGASSIPFRSVRRAVAHRHVRAVGKTNAPSLRTIRSSWHWIHHRRGSAPLYPQFG